MSNMVDQAPRRIPEWLSLADIARAWSEETGTDAAAFEEGFRDWFKDYLLRNAYGNDDGGIPARLLEGRQIWRETFETFCEERNLAKPRFWFPDGGPASATPQPAPSERVPVAETGAAETVAEAPDPSNQDDKAPSRRRVREGGTSFTWIAAGLVVAVVAGLVALWLQDKDAPVADANPMNGAVEEIQLPIVASVQPAPPQSAPAAMPAPTTGSDPAAAQIAAAQFMVNRTDTGATSFPEVPAAGRAVAAESVDQGLVLLLQRELLAAGYDPGPLDGLLGTKFAAAVAGYQRANKLPADGRASIELLSRLARENLKAGRMVPIAPVGAPVAAPGAAAAPKTGQGAGRRQTTALEPGAAPPSRAVATVPAPRGRALVRAIQKRLSDRGYYGGSLDGSLGPKTREAIETYQRVQRYDVTGRPSRAIYEELEDYALEVRGLDQFRKGAYDAAAATYSRIIQRKPKNADAYFNRGLAHKNAGRTERALSDYEAAIALDPAHRKAYLDRANILYDQGLYGDAIRDYWKALRLLLSFS